MAGYQWIHFENYARKARETVTTKSGKQRKPKKQQTVQRVLDEADRVPGNAPHVDNPERPSVVYGCSIDELRHQHEAVEAVQVIDRRGKASKMRSTQASLATSVLSYPIPVEEIQNNLAELERYQRWEKLSIEFMQRLWGDDFKTAVRHTDERFPHLHCYGLDPDFLVDRLHPGLRETIGKTGKEAGIAAAGGLRQVQDDYFREVAALCGMTRDGPKRERLSRPEWQQKQRNAELLESVHVDAERKSQEAQQLANEILRDAESEKTQIYEGARREGLQAGADDFAGSDLITRVVMGASMKAINLRDSAYEQGKQEGKSETTKKAKRSIDTWKKKDKQSQEKIQKLTREKEEISESLKKERSRSADISEPLRNLKRENEALKIGIEMTFERMNMSGIDIKPYLEEIHTVDDALRLISKDIKKTVQGLYISKNTYSR